MRRELGLCSTNSEAIIVVVDVIDEIFFVDFKIKQLMTAIVVEDVINRGVSRMELSMEINVSSFYDGF